MSETENPFFKAIDPDGKMGLNRNPPKASAQPQPPANPLQKLGAAQSKAVPAKKQPKPEATSKTSAPAKPSSKVQSGSYKAPPSGADQAWSALRLKNPLSPEPPAQPKPFDFQAAIKSSNPFSKKPTQPTASSKNLDPKSRPAPSKPSSPSGKDKGAHYGTQNQTKPAPVKASSKHTPPTGQAGNRPKQDKQANNGEYSLQNLFGGLSSPITFGSGKGTTGTDLNFNVKPLSELNAKTLIDGMKEYFHENRPKAPKADLNDFFAKFVMDQSEKFPDQADAIQATVNTFVDSCHKAKASQSHFAAEDRQNGIGPVNVVDHAFKVASKQAERLFAEGSKQSLSNFKISYDSNPTGMFRVPIINANWKDDAGLLNRLDGTSAKFFAKREDMPGSAFNLGKAIQATSPVPSPDQTPPPGTFAIKLGTHLAP